MDTQWVKGPWKSGMILDWHTVSSEFIGSDEFGRSAFDTKRTELGELLHRFKYRRDRAALQPLLALACKCLQQYKGVFNVVIPVPASSQRNAYVTAGISGGLASFLDAQFLPHGLKKTKSTEQMKNTSVYERKKILSGAMQADPDGISGKTVLLVDDLYQSGATLKEAAIVLRGQGRAKEIHVLALTRTRH